MQPIYLDHNATTPVDARVLDKMMPWFSAQPGNASNTSHAAGQAAAAAVDAARQQVGVLIGAQRPLSQVHFTSGATESNNLAIAGLMRGLPAPSHFITQSTEHKAVLATGAHLKRAGHDVQVVRVDGEGFVDPDDIRAAIRPETRLVSIMLANNEVGTVQRVAEIGAICREHDVVFHCDAVQGVGRLECDVEAMHIDLLSLSAHKIYGPKGVGALYVASRTLRERMQPGLLGGGQEHGLRSGTLNVPGIVGLGAAAELMKVDRSQAVERETALRERLWTRLRELLDGVSMNGPATNRLPGNLNVALQGVDAEALLARLSQTVAASTGAACTSATIEPSHVLRAMGMSDDRAYSSVRFGIGRGTTEDEVDRAAALVADAASAIRHLS